MKQNRIGHRAVGIFVLAGCCGGLIGCGSLPSSGPSISNIKANAERENRAGAYEFIPVDQNVIGLTRERGGSGSLNSLTQAGRPTRANAERLGKPRPRRISVGDALLVNIFTSGGGLFGAPDATLPSSPGVTPSSAALPRQIVDSSGEITVPYVGRVKVAGLTSAEVENEITERLKPKILTPSTIVTIQSNLGSSLVTVTGDVRNPQRVEVPVAGLRLVDAIAAAGGPSARDYETLVTVTRGNATGADYYGDIIRNSQKNILLGTGDTVVLSASRWSYTTLGATTQKRIEFPNGELSLTEAIAGSDGLMDNRANPEAVFVYRFESPDTVKKLGGKARTVTDFGVPVIYQINLRRADGLFLASQFAVRDKDTIFVGNAGTVGFMKALGIFNAITAPVVQGASVATGIGTISALNNR